MIKVKVCCGTSCYIMGASELIEMDMNKFKSVELEGTTCMNLCQDIDKRPPYIKINGKVYSEVTPKKLTELLEGEFYDL
ncbi:hypothetical protein EW093_00235 [Thiospirochaeta perfilievii]|uniref:(2Fe-2S) ferredoxin domain-containing protein n=1 Tax=Thiospirochaeta perfilievii TaxID=252967 RepID=A0A5C1Q959_9SPIO|nr:NAD(P)H-dependent oxidoreductase subunit E [Thiospirochaeta perfilievii]QEN03194.1 hypothetical protein EW093_00235 [Thiospirochaeta perfilievii]